MKKILITALGLLGLTFAQMNGINCQKSDEEPVVISAPPENNAKQAERDVSPVDSAKDFQTNLPETPKTILPRLYLGQNDRIETYSLEKWAPKSGMDCFYRADSKFYNSKNELVWGGTLYRSVGLYGDQRLIAQEFPFDETILSDLDRLVIEFTLEKGCNGNLLPPRSIEIKLTLQLIKEYVQERDNWVRGYYQNNPR